MLVSISFLTTTIHYNCGIWQNAKKAVKAVNVLKKCISQYKSVKILVCLHKFGNFQIKFLTVVKLLIIM